MLDKENFKNKFNELNKKILNIKDIDVGILGGINEKYWVDCGNKQYLFKYNRDKKDFTDFGEVFTSYICFILGVNCVKAIFSDDLFEREEGKKSGVLVESYRTKNVKESFSLSSLKIKYKLSQMESNTVKSVLSLIKAFCEDNDILLDNNIEEELKEMALMDYLLMQTDRHAKNIEFLVIKKDENKILKLAPMFDNGFCLSLQDSESFNKEYLEELLNKKYLEVDEFCDLKFYIGESKNIFEDNSSIIKDLAKELLQNKKLMKIYQNFCKLNFSEEAEFISSIRKSPLPNLNKDVIKYGIEQRIRFLDLEILKQETILEQKKYNRKENVVKNDIFEL